MVQFLRMTFYKEFNGVPGTYIKSFLISDKIDSNNVLASKDTSIFNLILVGKFQWQNNIEIDSMKSLKSSLSIIVQHFIFLQKTLTYYQKI